MNRIDLTFSALSKTKTKAFIPFVTAGDGGMDTTEALVLELIHSGANLVEIGVPFSDPIAEGPVIQTASARALKNGTKLTDIFALVKRLRKKTEVPLLLMLYLNSIFGYGTERFFQEAAQAGIDGVIVPDMPYEERDEIEGTAQQYGIYSIRIVTPISKERIHMISTDAKGFLYCVSSTGVTGVRSQYQTDFEAFFTAVKESAHIPCAVGFGISGPEQASSMKQYCDGIIIGSAIVELAAKNAPNSIPAVAEFAASIRHALDFSAD